ncbi:hypothetical protein CYY_004937 [Polysphondylium violaceum]|uniref:Fungal lipase-type domain-containing protein n=1 Tax=Polysphondylium violaceum TaxID=133409 RepID=A0A8J4V006_9MYCE|nr:hypothetical protein CYY_004937 [Polysphondylium violaceum]
MTIVKSSSHSSIYIKLEDDNEGINESQWIYELKSLLLKDQKESSLTSTTNQTSSTLIPQPHTKEFQRILSSILSKLSYFSDLNSITEYIQKNITSNPYLGMIKKLYYFKPIHTRNRVLIGLDHFDDLYCCFSGTEHLSDLFIDISCGFLEKIKFDGLSSPHHSLYSNISRMDWALSIVENLMIITQELKKNTLIFCGHSIGSTFANFSCLEAIKIKNKYQKQLKKLEKFNSNNNNNISTTDISSKMIPIHNISLKCFTFGSPSYLHISARNYLDQNSEIEDIFESFLNEFDIVPMMSHYPFIFIDFFYLLVSIMIFTFSILYRLLWSRDILTVQDITFSIIYPIGLIMIPLVFTQMIYYTYQLLFSSGLQYKNTKVYYHKEKKFIKQKSGREVEFEFRSIFNHLKKLYNLKNLLIVDHSIEQYIQNLLSFDHNDYNDNNDSNSNETLPLEFDTDNGYNTITANEMANTNQLNLKISIEIIKQLERISNRDIIFLPSNSIETIEKDHIMIKKKSILKRGLGILIGFYTIWVSISLPIFYQSLNILIV